MIVFVDMDDSLNGCIKIECMKYGFCKYINSILTFSTEYPNLTLIDFV